MITSVFPGENAVIPKYTEIFPDETTSHFQRFNQQMKQTSVNNINIET